MHVTEVYLGLMLCHLDFQMPPLFFQELMSIVLVGLWHFLVAYLDDILVFSETLEDHIRHLETIFSTCVREVRSFIGMSSYYRRFIPNFSEIAEPIIALTKKHAHFKWTPIHQKAFDYLECLSVVPLLAYPHSNKPYTLYTDASGTCIGACLKQSCEPNETGIPNVPNEKPIYYLSHKLSKTQCKWSTVEKKAYMQFTLHYRNWIIMYMVQNL